MIKRVEFFSKINIGCYGNHRVIYTLSNIVNKICNGLRGALISYVCVRACVHACVQVCVCRYYVGIMCVCIMYVWGVCRSVGVCMYVYM